MNISSETSRMKKRVPPATEAFRILTATLLSLILPLSFLLLARVCVARYLRISAATHNHHDSFHLSSIFFLITEHPIILQLLVSLITVSCLAHSLTEFVFAASISPPEPFERFHLHIAWILLSFFHIFVGLGVEGSIAAGVSGCGFGQQRSFVCRVVFFLGLHKEMMFWSRMVVRPVVDDTFFGFSKGEGWADKVAMGLSLGGLWWWSLREEVEAVVVLPEIMGVGAVGFVWWWLYCSTASIGVVMVAKGCISTVGVIFRRTDASEGESRPVHIPWKLQIEPV